MSTAAHDAELMGFMETRDQDALLAEQTPQKSSPAWSLRRSWRAAAVVLAVFATLSIGAAAWWNTTPSSQSAMGSASAEGPAEMMEAFEKRHPLLKRPRSQSQPQKKEDKTATASTKKAKADGGWGSKKKEEEKTPTPSTKKAKADGGRGSKKQEEKKPSLMKQLADARAEKAAQAAAERQEKAAKAAAAHKERAANAAKQAAQRAAEVKARVTARKAEAKYSEPVAKAFAAMAKLSYCGPLPGIYAAVASSCRALWLPGASTSCERAGFGVVPGTVRLLSAADMNVMNSLFGFVAKVVPTGKNSTMKSGVLLAFRGSIDNFANSVRDKQTRMAGNLEGCEGCEVHEGYHESYRALKQQLDLHLASLWCWAKDCVVHVTGHGSGAAMATMFAWELRNRNFTIGSSYIFESPQIANDVFAERLTDKFNGEGKDGPIFSITTGKDSVPRWPFNASFTSWGIEAHYPDSNASKHEPLCPAGSEGCGIKKVPKGQLTSQDSCNSNLAPFGSFCTFKAFAPQCYGGLGYETVKLLPHLPGMLPQPREQSAATWHPSSEDGEQQKAVKANGHTTKPEDWYSLKTLQAFSALAKLAYCGGTRGLANAVQSTCTGSHGVCSAAGFGVVPTSVVGVGVSYQSELTRPYYMQDTLFFYTALIRRTSAAFAKKPYFMPSEACVLVIRGSNNEQNSKMNNQNQQIPLNDTECRQCTANEGVLMAWQQALQAKVLAALKHSGCEAHPQKETVKKVFIVGHSMGGTMSGLAMYFLNKLGFDVQLSWLIEAGRPGNPALMDYLNNAMLADKRPVPFWQVTHSNDFVPRTAKSTFNGGKVGRHRFQVHFNSSNLGKATLCTSRGDMGKGSDCGIYQFDREDLDKQLPSQAHCGLPFAPQGQICMLPGYPAGTPYAMANQCSWGGSIKE